MSPYQSFENSGTEQSLLLELFQRIYESERNALQGLLTNISELINDGRNNTTRSDGGVQLALFQTYYVRALIEAVKNIEKKLGVKLVFNGMFRTTEYQAELRRDYETKLKEYNNLSPLERLLKKPPPFADKPGESSHELGVSFDINHRQYSDTQMKIIVEVFRSAGFIRNVFKSLGDPTDEYWHFTASSAAEQRRNDRGTFKRDIANAQDNYRRYHQLKGAMGRPK